MTDSLPRIGFVGASGLMGHGMAKNLLAAGYPLAYTVRSRDPESLREAGAVRVADHAELGRTCDIVIICVTSADDVTEVVTGPNGLLREPREGLLIVDSSTSEPTVTRRLIDQATARGVRFIDAPLTRTPREAEQGRLNVLVGADAATLTEVRPVLETFAENIIPIGPPGSAHIVKLLNNFIVMAGAAALSEAFAVAARSGVDPQSVVDVVSMGFANSGLLAVMGETLHGDTDKLMFELDNARKDVRYYTRLAGDAGHPTPIGDGVHETFCIASALGFGRSYVPDVVRAQEKLAGVPIRATGEGSA